MYEIVSHFTGRNENLCQSCIFSNICHSLISYIILTLRYNTSCIKFSIQKSQAVHKLEEVVFPKNIILLTQKIFILTQMPLKSKSKISLSTRDTVQCFPRQYPYNVTGSFTIFREKCDDGWGIKVMCQPYYKWICKVMRVVARWPIFGLKR